MSAASQVMPVLPLAGRHALVTGASRGIGAAIARSLAQAGAQLTLLGRTAAPLQALADELGPVHGFACADVADAAQVQAAVDAARAARGPVLMLVNNAGQAESAPFARTSAELWQRMLAVNLTGCFTCTQAVLPDMRTARRGRIVNIASTAAQRGYAYVSAYVAAKHGVLGLTRALALELAAEGITVNAVCPGYTETEILRQSIEKVVARTGRSTEAARAEFSRFNPQGRFVQPEEVADAVRWLCGSGAAAITGQAISVSGGEVM
ncbi:MAG TPA: SDR family NAD(P)-dependent oxidoreductase [Rubrivivax sp.]|nr:SDR family oxidoreductase [Burkholderiales bacterium]HNT38475.1 SDR family NAD(P)-dependent oxidoreductase [Rubrivivax sp.]